MGGWTSRGNGKEAAHFSCLTGRNGERENPTDFPRGMQIRIEISRENVKDPMRFVRVAARVANVARAVGNNYQKSSSLFSLSGTWGEKGCSTSREV